VEGSGATGGGAQQQASAATGVAPVPIDAREFVDEVDLPKKLKASDFGTLVASEKRAQRLILQRRS
jgi:hypothetical protein